MRPDLITGSPGGHAATLCWRARLRALGLGVLAAGSALAIAPLLSPSPLARATAVLLGVLAVVCGAASRHFAIAAAKAAAGARSERKVAAVLARQPVGAVLHSQLLGAGGDVDHVVAGPVLAAVETKTGRGKVRYDRSGFSVGGRTLPTDPVAQVRRQASALSRLAGAPATGVVCVVDATSPPFTRDQVTVCSLADLPKVLAGLPRVLDPAMLRTLVDRLQHTGQPDHPQGTPTTTSRSPRQRTEASRPPVPPVTSNSAAPVPKLRPLRRDH